MSGVMRPAPDSRRMLRAEGREGSGDTRGPPLGAQGTWRLPGKRTDVPVPCHRQGRGG